MSRLCDGLLISYNEYMAQTPPDLYHAAQVWDMMNDAGCSGVPADPDPTNQSGGHGHSLPVGG